MEFALNYLILMFYYFWRGFDFRVLFLYQKNMALWHDINDFANSMLITTMLYDMKEAKKDKTD